MIILGVTVAMTLLPCVTVMLTAVVRAAVVGMTERNVLAVEVADDMVLVLANGVAVVIQKSGFNNVGHN